MTLKFKGKVWVFGDNLDVDKEIISFSGTRIPAVMKDGNYGRWCMTPRRPRLPQESKKR